mgnify:CR=1 FL=1
MFYILNFKYLTTILITKKFIIQFYDKASIKASIYNVGQKINITPDKF